MKNSWKFSAGLDTRNVSPWMAARPHYPPTPSQLLLSQQAHLWFPGESEIHTSLSFDLSTGLKDFCGDFKFLSWLLSFVRDLTMNTCVGELLLYLSLWMLVHMSYGAHVWWTDWKLLCNWSICEGTASIYCKVATDWFCDLLWIDCEDGHCIRVCGAVGQVSNIYFNFSSAPSISTYPQNSMHIKEFHQVLYFVLWPFFNVW